MVAVTLLQRAQIIVHSCEGKLNQEIDAIVGLRHDQVGI